MDPADLTVGDHVQWIDGMRKGAGEPLSAETKSGYLGMTRIFFRDLQEWEWIPRRSDVATALRTPRSVNALLGPDPRVIAAPDLLIRTSRPRSHASA